MILLDTNVISELMKPRPEPNVVAWLGRQPAKDVFIRITVLQYGAALAWGECAALLLAIKLRGVFRELKPVARPWWAHFIGGVVNTLAIVAVMSETTARNPFWPALGGPGSFFVATLLAALLAMALSAILAPGRKRL